jgi:hypothetical protein
VRSGTLAAYQKLFSDIRVVALAPCDESHLERGWEDAVPQAAERRWGPRGGPAWARVLDSANEADYLRTADLVLVDPLERQAEAFQKLMDFVASICGGSALP